MQKKDFKIQICQMDTHSNVKLHSPKLPESIVLGTALEHQGRHMDGQIYDKILNFTSCKENANH